MTSATTLIRGGTFVNADRDLRAEEAAGSYLKRQPFGANFDAMRVRARASEPTAVARAAG